MQVEIASAPARPRLRLSWAGAARAVLPVTILVILIGLLFAWALVRAVKRDLLSTPA